MALTGLHSNWENGSYQADRDQRIKISENAGLALGTDLSGLKPHFDGKTSIAIGYGFDLLENDNATINSYLTTANGQATTLTAADIALLNEARAKKKAGTATSAYLESVATQLSISLVSEPSATTLLDLKLTKYETALDTALGGHDQLADSKERIAVLSLLYTMVDPVAAKISNKIPATIAAIKNDNRAEAWYEIRYGSNSDGQHASRRYSESSLFGLYDAGTTALNISQTESKEALRMFTRHYATIQTYEATYTPPSSIDAELSIAKDRLISLYSNGRPIDGQVFVGADTGNYLRDNPNDTLVDTNKNDLIFGESGNDLILAGSGDDVIYGGDGNDTLYGGIGDDLIYGGAGDDIYYVNTGDGTDTLEDKEGNNTLILNGITIKLLIKKANGIYNTPDGRITAVMQGTDLVVTDTWTGTSVILNENFTDGDFGIRIVEEADYTNTLTNQQITLTSGNDTGNYYVEPNINYTVNAGGGNDVVVTGNGSDELYGEGGNDMLYGGTGDDRIYGGADADILVGDNAKVYTSLEGQQYNTIDGRDYIEGNEGNDHIMGGFLDDILIGGTGDDTIYGEYDAQYAGKNPVPNTSQDDYIDGGDGDDTIYGDMGNDTLVGGMGADIIVGDRDPLPPGNDIIDGGDGNDQIEGGGGDDLLVGGSGDDTILGGNGSDTVYGGTGMDTLQGDAGNDYLNGEADDDTIFGVDGDDTISGGDGNDWLQGDAGNDNLDGETGDDTILGVDGDDVIYGGDGNDELHGDSIDTAVSAQGNDTLNGEAGDDTLLGYGGNDVLFGGDGTDWLQGDEGDDIIDGEAGNDTILGGVGDDVMYGGDDGDILYGEAGNDTLQGDEGSDTLFGVAGDDSLSGGAGDDWLQGDGGNDYLEGGAGKDTILGMDGDDAITGGDGDDDLYGDSINTAFSSQGNDTINGESGDDTLVGYGGNDVLSGGDGNDWLQGDEGDDILTGDAGDDTILGGDGNDVLTGGTGKNWLQGDEGDDTLNAGAEGDILLGGAGNDLISGGAGADTIYAGEGNDIIAGGGGDDYISGDAGNDTYLFGRGSGMDTVIDFDSTEGNFDAILLDNDIQSSDVTLLRGGDDLYLIINDTNDQLTIADYFTSDNSKIEVIRFGDGTEWNGSVIQANTVQPANSDDSIAAIIDSIMIDGGGGNDQITAQGGNNTLYGGAENDQIQGGVDGDTINGGTGDDYLIGGGGNDTIDGGTDSDYIEGGSGNNILLGGDGNDVLIAGEGVNTLDGGAGDDDIDGSLGENTYILRRGGGFDTVTVQVANSDLYVDLINAVQFKLTNLSSGLIDGSYFIGEGNPLPVLPPDLPADIQAQFDAMMNTGLSPDSARAAFTSLIDWLNKGDTVVFGPGVTPGDLSVQIGPIVGGEFPEGAQIAIGIGNDDGLLIKESYGEGGYGGYGGYGRFGGSSGGGYYWYDGLDPTMLDTKRFLFADGQVLTLEEILARADNGVIGFQEGAAGDDVLIGSVAADYIYGGDGNDKIAGRGNADFLRGETGDDVISAGSGSDEVIGGEGSDIIAGERGDDYIIGDAGSDTYLFNRGDGSDFIDNYPGSMNGDTDTLSFGKDITPQDVSAYADADGNLVLLVNGGTDRITMSWFDPFNGFTEWEGSELANVQFIDQDGNARIFDLKAVVDALKDQIIAASADNPVALFTDATAGFEVTGVVPPAGGDDAVDYAQTGILFPESSGGGTGSGWTPDPDNNDSNVNILVGGKGDDTLSSLGTTGPTIINGGGGNDTLIGKEGDTFSVGVSAGPSGSTGGGSTGGGKNTVTVYTYIPGNTGPNTTVEFGTGYDNGYFTWITTGSLAIHYGDQGDEVHIENFNPNDVYGSQVIDLFKFTDRTFTYQELIALGFDLKGTDGDDVLTGTNVTDRFYGEAGNDILSGGQGNDSYYFNLGDGADTIIDSAADTEGNRIVFGEGIVKDDLSFKQAGNLFTITVGTNGDAIRLANFNPSNPNVRILEFADGTTLDILTIVSDPNTAPVVSTPLPDQMVAQGTPLSLTIPADTFTDQDIAQGDSLTYSATLADGTALPAWLTFDADTGTFSGTAGMGDLGVLPLKITATDTGGLSADAYFNLTIANMITGSIYNDTINGTAGMDYIQAGAGNDTVNAGDGNDIVDGGTGSDVTSGGAGDDTFLISGTDTGYDRFQGDAGYDIIQGSDIDDTIRINNFSGTFTVEKIDGGLGTNVIAGTQYNDTIDLSGTELVNIAGIDGGAGNDVITGSAGSDTIIGSTGSDVLSGGAGNDTFLISGTDTGYDRFQGDGGYDVIQGGAGDDAIRVNNFSGTFTVEKIDGGLGTNIVAGTQYNDTIDLSGTELVNIANIDGGAGNDVITGSSGNDIIIGGAGSDVLAGGSGDDTFQINGTDTGYDRFQGDAGYDIIQGGAGDDTVRVNNFSGAYTVEKIDGGLGVNVIAGTQYNDTIDLNSTELANISNIDGGTGNDVIIGSAGNDTIVGGIGSDVLAGGSGDDNFLVSGTDAGYDRFQGDAGYDTIQGGNGDDTIRVNNFSSSYTVEKIDGGLGTNIIAGTQYNDTIDLSGTELVNIANIDGGAGNDTITGSSGNDIIIGGAGSDVLAGGSGDDTFQINGTDTGYDRFQGDGGYDVIQGGDGDDTIRVNNFSSSYTVEKIDGGLGTNVIAGTQYNDTIDLSGTELVNIANLDGGAGNDTITGSAGNDTIIGGAGNDTLKGGIGNDTYLFGVGGGNDTINDYDTTAGNEDAVQISVNPLDLIFSKSGTNLVVGINGTTDQITVQNWNSGSASQTEIFKGLDGSSLLNTQVDQLIQAMATFSANNGMTWSQAIQDRPQDVQQVLAQYWQPQA